MLKTNLSSRAVWRGAIMLSAISILTGCESAEVAEPESTASAKTYVAFAGGGWRAHTGHAAWMVALLDNQSNPTQTSLDTAFANVSAISSNSGGSWFNVMLSYSSVFRGVLEDSNATTSYLSNPKGYFQLEKTAVNNAPVQNQSAFCKVIHVLSDYMAFLCDKGLYWDAIVEDIVFQPLSMSSSLKGTRLDSPQAWSQNKGIVLASTALTQGGVLTSSLSTDKYYYDTSHLSPLNVAPVTLSAKANSTDPQLPVFPGGYSNFVVNYKNTGVGLYPPGPVAPKPNNSRNISSEGLNVIDSAAASSAAMGFMGSHAIVENNNNTLRFVPATDWEIAYETDGFSLNFDLPAAGGTALQRSTSTPREDNQKNANLGYIKFADGGPLDNSGVAHSVMYHQLNHDVSVPFSIIAFDNVIKTYPRRPTTKPMSDVGVDIANLFGHGFTSISGGKFQGMCAEGICVRVTDSGVSPKIFDHTGLVTSLTWQETVPSASGTSLPCELLYTPYAVTTVQNDMLGIKPGYSGTLHSFTAKCPSAGTAPTSTADWTAYEDMFKAIQTGMKQNGGLAHLKAAFQ